MLKQQCNMAAVAVALSLSLTPALAVDPTINVLLDGDAAILGTDYDVVTTSPASPAFPNIELIQGGTWDIWSVDTDNPNDIGDIGEITCPHADDFEIKLENPNNGDDGAREVKNINLDPQGTGSDGNYSNVVGGTISTLSGILNVQESDDATPVGGKLDLEVTGNVSGAITAYEIGVVTIGGTLSAASTIDSIPENKSLTIDTLDALLSIATITGALSIETVSSNINLVVTDLVSDGLIRIETQLTGVLTVQDLAGDVVIETIGSNGLVSSGTNSPHPAMSGSITFTNGLAAGNMTFHGDFDGTVDLKGKGLAGIFTPNGTGVGQLINGGILSGFIEISDHGVTGPDSKWSATFSSVSATAQIKLNDPDNDPGIQIYCDGDFAGDILSSTTVDVTSDFLLSIDKDLTSGASLDFPGDFFGDISITGTSYGTIDIAGDTNNRSRIDVTEDVSGSITVDGTADGYILIDGDLDATLTVGGDLTGDIDIAGDADADIVIDGALGAGGRILVGGTLNAAIEIDDETNSTSDIKLTGGFGTGGSIVINAIQEDNDADGDILIGKASTPYSSIAVEGCIQILDASSDGDFGDLDGDININGCHTANQVVNICVDGDTNGSINISQSGCFGTYFVTATCDTECTCGVDCPS